MRLLRSLFALALLCGAFLQAKADDFQMIVIDPSGFNVVDIFTTTFTFTFSPCDAGQGAPSNFVGCFTGANLTGSTITSLEIDVPKLVPDGTGGSQPAGCSTLAGIGSFFDSCTADQEGQGYVLNFAGGNGIPSNAGQKSIFTIAEQGASPEDFGTMTAIAGTATPEPDSLALLATGILSGGGYLMRRRRANRS